MFLLCTGIAFFAGRESGISQGSIYTDRNIGHLAAQLVYGIPPFEFGPKDGELTLHSGTRGWLVRCLEANQSMGILQPQYDFKKFPQCAKPESEVEQ